MKPNSREIAMLVALLIVAAVYVDGKLESKTSTPIVIYERGENAFADTVLPSPEDASVESENTALSGNNTTLKQEIGNSTAPQSNSSYQPQEIRIVQPHKYAEYDFTVEMKVSASPVVLAPWSGNGVPFINLYYRFPNGTAFNDTGMLHNGFVYTGGFVGYNFCAQGIMRFWKWEHMEPPGLTNEPLVYWSEPAPEDPYQLLGSGENCYTRAAASSSWLVQACYEGDGEITPYYQEVMENGDVIRYHDPMDECWSIVYQFPT